MKVYTYIHLRNSLTLDNRICYILTIYVNMLRSLQIKHDNCPLYGNRVHSCFTIFLICCVVVCCNFIIWIYTAIWFGKREKGYEEQCHCLTYMLSGLHEIWQPQPWPIHLMIPQQLNQSTVWENRCSSAKRVAGLCDKAYKSLNF